VRLLLLRQYQIAVIDVPNDVVTDADFNTQFGFVPASLEWAISTYAAPHDIRERYNFYRKEAGRDAKELV